MDSLLWAYLGSRRFPRELGSFLMWRFFTLSSDDRRVLHRQFRSRSRLAAALQLGFVRQEQCLSTLGASLRCRRRS